MSRLGTVLAGAVVAGAAQASLPWLPLQPVLACVVLVPLLVVLEGASPRATVVAGIAYATVLAEVAFLPWLGAALGRYFELTWLGAQLLSAATAATLGIVHGTVLGAVLALRPRRTGALLVAWYGTTWALWEALRDWLPPYFQGAALGASLERSLPLLQLASVTGVAAVTAVVVAANAGIAALLTTSPARATRAARARALATGVGVVVLATAWGTMRLAAPLPDPADAPVVLAIDVDASDASASTLAAYLAATPTDRGAIDLVLWPESALNLDLARDRAAWRRIADFTERTGATLVTGGITVAITADGGEKRFNSLHVIRPRFGVESYHKRLLVPLTEAWPSFLGAPPPSLEPVVAGRTLPVLRAGGTAFGPLVCFEVGDAASARTLARDGARFLVNASNDIWFRGGEAPHLRWARVRAIESGLPVVRVANAGVSGVVDTRGRLAASSVPAGAPGVLEARVPDPVATVYVATGEVFLPACAIVVLLGVAGSVVARRRALVSEAVLGGRG